MKEWVQLAISVGALVFLAGGGWYAIKRMARDLNGLGMKTRQNEALQNERHYREQLWKMVVTESKEEREKIFQAFK